MIMTVRLTPPSPFLQQRQPFFSRASEYPAAAWVAEFDVVMPERPGAVENVSFPASAGKHETQRVPYGAVIFSQPDTWFHYIFLSLRRSQRRKRGPPQGLLLACRVPLRRCINASMGAIHSLKPCARVVKNGIIPLTGAQGESPALTSVGAGVAPQFP